MEGWGSFASPAIFGPLPFVFMWDKCGKDFFDGLRSVDAIHA